MGNYLILETLCETYSQLFQRKLTDYSLGEEISTIVDDDLVELSNWLLYVHEVLGVKMRYLPLHETNKFKSFYDVLIYFVEQVKRKESRIAS